MMSLLPIVPQTTPAMLAGSSAGDKSGADFAETLRSESSALERTAQRSGGRDTQSPHEAQTSHELQASREEAAPAERPVSPGKAEAEAGANANGPDRGASHDGAAGEQDSAASAPAPKVEKRSAVGGEASINSAQVEAAPLLPEWLLVPQVVATPLAAVPGKMSNLATGLTPQGVNGVAELPVGLEQAGLAWVNSPARGSEALAAPQMPPVPVAAGGKVMTGEQLAPEHAAAMAASLVESTPVAVPLVSAGGAEQAPPRTANVEPWAMNENSGGLGGYGGAEVLAPRPAGRESVPLIPVSSASGESLGQPGVAVAAPLVGVEPMVATPAMNLPLTPQVAASAAGSDPVVLGQVASPEGNGATLRTERPAQIAGGNAPALGVGQPGDPGVVTVKVVTPDPADAGSEGRQFSSLSHNAAGEMEKSAKPGDGGPDEFSAMVNRPDNQLSGSVARSTTPAQSAAVAATPLPVPEARIVDQVVSRLGVSGASAESNLSLLLHPKELGEVRVDLVSGKDGLRAHLHSQTQMVQEVLERNLPRLREAFESQGLKISDLQVSCDGRRDGGNPTFQQREPGQMVPSRYRVADATEPEWLGGLERSNSGWSAAPGFSLRV